MSINNNNNNGVIGIGNSNGVSIKKRFFTKKRTVDNTDMIDSSTLQQNKVLISPNSASSSVSSSVLALSMKISQDDNSNNIIDNKDIINNSNNETNDVVLVKKQSHLTQHQFKDLSISVNTKKALIDKMKYQYMTAVQHESLPQILEGHDVLVKAKTGTGKTLGFLIPAIEVLIMILDIMILLVVNHLL